MIPLLALLLTFTQPDCATVAGWDVLAATSANVADSWPIATIANTPGLCADPLQVRVEAPVQVGTVTFWLRARTATATLVSNGVTIALSPLPPVPWPPGCVWVDVRRNRVGTPVRYWYPLGCV